MKRIYKVYKKTVSIVNETPTAMYENLVGSRKGFLLESYDKNYDRYTFLGEPEELISSEGESLVITKKSGEREVRRGNPLALLKEYYDEFEIHKENDELNFSGGLVGNVGYDFIRYSEKLPEKNPDEIGIETIQLMLMKAFIVICGGDADRGCLRGGDGGRKKACRRDGGRADPARHASGADRGRM